MKLVAPQSASTYPLPVDAQFTPALASATQFQITGTSLTSGKAITVTFDGTGLTYDQQGLSGGKISEVVLSVDNAKYFSITQADYSAKDIGLALNTAQSTFSQEPVATALFSGDDWMYGSQSNDTLNGGAGNDFLKGADGNDELYGSDGNDNEWGGKGVDTLFGGSGDDFMFGGAGNDTLIMGNKGDTNVLLGGEDDNAFWALRKDIAAGTHNLIGDFFTGYDKLFFNTKTATDFGSMSTPFTGLGTAGRFGVNDARFYAAEGAVKGHDASDRIVYNQETGDLYYDVDGSGKIAAILVATVGLDSTVKATDIWVS